MVAEGRPRVHGAEEVGVRCRIWHLGGGDAERCLVWGGRTMSGARRKEEGGGWARGGGEWGEEGARGLEDSRVSVL